MTQEKQKKVASVDPDAERVAFWEKLFPGKGAALMDVLWPFYDWKPELKAELPDLEARARQAIFWRKFERARIFRADQLDSFESLLGTLLQASLMASLMDSLMDSLGSSLWNMFLISLRFSLNDLLLLSFRVSLGDLLCAPLRDLLCASLFFASGFALAGKPEEAAKFKPLHELCLAGNFPLGFDKEGNLLVLVA